IDSGRLKVVAIQDANTNNTEVAFNRTLAIGQRYTIYIDVIQDVSEAGFVCMGAYVRRVRGRWQISNQDTPNQPPWSPNWQFEVYENGTFDFYAGGELVKAGQPCSSGKLAARLDGGSGQTQYYDNLKVVPHIGIWTSQPLDLSPVGTAAGSSIDWNATTPEDTEVTIETNLSLDGG